MPVEGSLKNFLAARRCKAASVQAPITVGQQGAQGGDISPLSAGTTTIGLKEYEN
jgi:hypothetical protein